jgi:ribosome-binding factor A
MDSTRRARLAAVIQQELSVTVPKLKDPRIPNVTFTQVEVTQDGAQA